MSVIIILFFLKTICSTKKLSKFMKKLYKEVGKQFIFKNSVVLL